MSSRTISRNDLVGTSSLSFLRPQTIKFDLINTKPNTRLYAFFDGISIDEYITPAGGVIGDPVITDSVGSLSMEFLVPGATFNTGPRKVILSESNNSADVQVIGNTVGYADAQFTSSGVLNTFQETSTNITTNYVTNVVTSYVSVIQPSVQEPPRAQTFVESLYTSLAGREGEAGGVAYWEAWQADTGKTQQEMVYAFANAVVVNSEPGTTIAAAAIALACPGGGDPLAQSFFTYGITGGCFITKIDLFFQSKDANLPVILEVRHLVNGYPGSSLVSINSRIVKSPADVSISNDASVATTMVFDSPLYLQEDKEYCFVLLANSNKYNVWTAEMAATSVETGKTIFEQPFIGSMFKSENNVTWTAEQTMDIKFKMYKAVFEKNVTRDITWAVNLPPIKISGKELSVTTGSPVINAKFGTQHGFVTGDRMPIGGQTGAVYRGIPATAFNITDGPSVIVINDYELSFNVGSNATSTGTLETSGRLDRVYLVNGGSGYVNPLVSFVGGTGTGAAASAVVVSGIIVDFVITNPGSGYTTLPVVNISDVSGSGANALFISNGEFAAYVAKKFQAIQTIVPNFNPPGTTITTTAKTTNNNKVPGLHELIELNTVKSLDKLAVLMSTSADLVAGLQTSTEITTKFFTDNENVSPVIEIGNTKARMHNYIINDVDNSASELTPSAGTAQARYISKPVSLATPGKGIRIFVTAVSVKETNFDVFVRTSFASSNHRQNSWQKLDCTVERNLSPNWFTPLDYTLKLDNMKEFDTFDIKIVLYSSAKYVYPKIVNYRAIVLAT